MSHECVNGKLEKILGVPEGLPQSPADSNYGLNIVDEDFNYENYRVENDRIYYGQGEILDINDVNPDLLDY